MTLYVWAVWRTQTLILARLILARERTPSPSAKRKCLSIPNTLPYHFTATSAWTPAGDRHQALRKTLETDPAEQVLRDRPTEG